MAHDRTSARTPEKDGPVARRESQPAQRTQETPSDLMAQMSTSSPGAILKLQRLVGNRATRTLVGTSPVLVAQRAPVKLEDASAKAKESMAGFHKLGYEADEYSDLSAGELQQIQTGVYMLTGAHGDVKCNCFGWALGEDVDTGDKGRLYNWKKEHGGDSNFTDPDSGDANILLWGDKDGNSENSWDVLHASLRLSHAELLKRSGKYKGLEISSKDLKASGIPDPCWTSAGGGGFGIAVHPREWYTGGPFGEPLKGMKGPK